MFPVRTVDRFVSLVVGLFILLLLAAFYWPAGNFTLEAIISTLHAKPWRELLAGLIPSVFMIYLFWMGLRRRRQVKTILCDTPLGEIRIAESAVESLAMRATRRVRGVHNATVNVRASTDGLEIYVDTTLSPDLSIPQVSKDIETRVGDYIRETVGVSVNFVKVLVKGVASENRTRVE